MLKLKAGNTKLSKPGLMFMLAGCWVLVFNNEFAINRNFFEKNNILKIYNWLVFHLEVFYQIFPNSFFLFNWLFVPPQKVPSNVENRVVRKGYLSWQILRLPR